MKYIALALIGLFSLLTSPVYAQTGPQLNLQRIKISAGMHLIEHVLRSES